jgi:tetratricopeptide (TPR) repeat protein
VGAHAPEAERPWDARFGRLLALLCLAAAAARVAILTDQLEENPFARVPFSDGELYWKMAGELAGGGLGGEPFLVAPLYPALLGLLRACGGALVAVYGVQTALHLATAALVATAARARFGAREGLTAATFFLLLGEPALYAARVLSATLQLFLAAWLGWEWARLAGSTACGLPRAARAGLSLGLFALSFPAALALVPFLALWLARRAGLARAAWAAAAAGCAIAPASVHNLLASGELVPITAHSGITLAHGNDPASIGIYTPLAGVGRSIHEQHRDAARLFEREVGRAGSWSEVDAHFRRRVFAWWRAHPLDAAALLARKLHWTLTSRGYDNVATFALEREHGLGRRAALAPLELPWLLGLGLLGLALAARERRGVAPELALLLLPVLVCVVFHYSGRYRLVAAPALCALAGLGLVGARALPWPRAATLGVALLPLPLLASDAVVGFGALDFMRDEFARTLAHQHARAGRVREAEGDALAAERHYRRALAARPGEPIAARALYNLEVARGEFAGARAILEDLARAEPEDAEAHLALAWLLAGVADPALRDGDAALAHVREAERLLGAENADAMLARALAEAERGRFAEASGATLRGEELARACGDGALARSFASLRQALRAGRGVETPPRLLRIAGR